ncbi:MAG TPA: hypothetical protein ENK12_08335 [Gammaproteobacteria bacterium]|nr:hypothetical protein [Gammaproteobacteria bacterium]
MSSWSTLKRTGGPVLFCLAVLLSGCGGGSAGGEGDTAAGAPGAGAPRLTAQQFVPPGPSGFVTFESGQVRPLALSADGKELYAVNTPDGRLEIFTVTATSLVHKASVPVGMEPVALAVRNASEVWVVNHLSDSVSIVDVSAAVPRVTGTLLVGDEPRDIVFAGASGALRAFITTAHRGQNSPYSPTALPGNPGEVTTPGIGRADVWVFDAANPQAAAGGKPLTVLTHFTDTPRALTVSRDGRFVYVAGFQTGNQTTVVPEGAVCNGGATAPPCNPGGGPVAPGGMPAPNANTQGVPAPETGLIVKFDAASGQWRDELGRDWSNQVLFNLPDRDVFVIDATSNPPAQTARPFPGVGTILFNMVTNPTSGKIYVSNTEARNEVRFEGTRTQTGNTTVVGHAHEARITVIDPAAVTNPVQPRHLNKHIDYSIVPAPPGTADNSLATPMGMAVSSDGSTLYVAAFGSSKVGVFSTSQLEADTFVPSAASHIAVSGGGPSGLVLDEARNRLYVLTRFDNAVSVVDLASSSEVRHYGLHNPEPASVVAGRPFLYDARLTSSNGEASCAGCHVFADFDSLGWDLGDPEGVVLSNPNPNGPIPASSTTFHPMKGPMTTQSLRGLAAHGPMHWRGDRTAGRNGGDPLDEAGAFKEFNVAFAGLLGRSGPLTTAQMDAFTNFILQVTYPPNPNRPLDNVLTASQQRGSDFFFNNISTAGILTCNACHTIDPANGLFGGSGLMSFEAETQDFKIPHLRNMYQKVGMFGMPLHDGSIAPGDSIATGDQIRGFGFVHDGAVDTLFRFHSTQLFSFPGGDSQRRDVEQFMHAMDSNLRPIVGQQFTLTSTNAATATPRIQLMTAQMDAGNADVVVKGTIGGVQRGWVRLADGSYQSDRAAEASITEGALLALAQTAGQELTFTAVPPGTGVRAGIDRDNDLVLDADDNCPMVANADQADANGDGVGDACPLPCEPDFDNDGDVDGIDAAAFGADFGRLDCGTASCVADFDVDGDVDGQDAAVFAADFGRLDCPIN